MTKKEPFTASAGKKPVWWIALGAIVLIELAVLAWLRPDHSQWESSKRLHIAVAQQNEPVPVGAMDYHFLNQPERLTEISSQLSFSDGICGLFAPTGQPVHSDTATVELFYFEYKAGNPLFIEDVLGHAPEVCMKASGAILKEIHPERELTIEDQTLSVRVLEFETPLGNSPLWVFRITWLPEDSTYQAAEDAAMLRKERILGSMLGNPRPPARVILAGARNFGSEQSAWEAFDHLIGKQLTLRAPGEPADSGS